MKKRIAIIGTNGIPSKYGGFETLVEYLVEYLSTKFDITVFCSGLNSLERQQNYKRATLVYINLSANGWQSILFDIISLFRSYRRFDKILILGSSGCIILPFFICYKHKFIFNAGGLDWKRSKWNFFAQKYLKISESFGIRFSDFLISDNIGIQEYILHEYKRSSYLITYGGDQVNKIHCNEKDIIKYPFLSEKFAFSVARIQPDNNIELLLKSFNKNSKMPFVLVGNWNKSKYGNKIKKKYGGMPNLILIDAIYDHREINLLRSNCSIYLHGHSAGGTNPALVEAMSLGLPILAFKNSFNRFTTQNLAQYFSTSTELTEMIDSLSEDELLEIGKNMLVIANAEYKWKDIADKYASIFELN